MIAFTNLSLPFSPHCSLQPFSVKQRHTRARVKHERMREPEFRSARWAQASVLDLLDDTSSSTTVSTPCGSSSEGPYCNANCDTETPTCATQCAPGTVAKGGADIDRFNCDVSCGFTNATGQTYSGVCYFGSSIQFPLLAILLCSFILLSHFVFYT